MEPFFAVVCATPPTPTVAEVVFTTNMTGYQEVFTDPSYRGQIVVMTAPMIGNYGINTEDPESAHPQVAGTVVRELSTTYSSWRATGDLRSWLNASQIPILEEVDTRRLTQAPQVDRRDAGRDRRGRVPTPTRSRRSTRARPWRDWISRLACQRVSGISGAIRPLRTTSSRTTTESSGTSYGCSRSMSAELRWSRQRPPPRRCSSSSPTACFSRMGRATPQPCRTRRHHSRRLRPGTFPFSASAWGISCWDSRSAGEPSKMPYGHRGGNHPVREIDTGHVLITAQNHGFAVEGTEGGIPGAPDLEVTHINLNDQTIEGMRHRELPIFAVQYHPEAAPGPHDARPLFGEFLDAVRGDGVKRANRLTHNR